MRFSDVDPLSGADVLPLKRTYDSTSNTVGYFGRRWASLFDARARKLTIGADTAALVDVHDESGNAYLFHRSSPSAAYEQIGPAPGTAASMLQVSGSGWILSDPDRRLSRHFDANGRITRYTNAAGRGITITYSGSPSRPSRVDDDWGRPAWLPVYNAAGQIERINYDGLTDFWTYEYSADHLDRAISPAGVWRDYNGSGTGDDWRITAIVDPHGNTVETHAYDAAGRATDSHGPGDEIDLIEYWLPGRVTGEFKTLLHFKTGRVETHYERTIAGRMRTVEISGGCSSCGGSDATYVHDLWSGNVTRHQRADGYITENTYDASGSQRLSTRGSLRPSGCDPETDTTRCRKTADELRTAELTATAETVVTTYTYSDANWPQRPTVVTTDSLYSTENAPKSRTTTSSFDPVTGETLVETVQGWTGDAASPVEQTITTTVTLYDGIEGAAFSPGGAVFLTAWETLPQPSRMRKSVDGPRSDVTDATRYVYYPIDPTVPAWLRGRLAAIENAAGHITRFDDYDYWGNALTVVDPNGVQTTTVADSLGRRTSVTVEGIPGCDTTYDSLCATDLTTTLTYHGAGAIATEQRPGGGVTAYAYDSRSRLSTVSRGPSATDLREQQETTYDLQTGKKGLERLLAKEGTAWVEKTRTSFTYDTSGQLASQVHADGSSIVYAYDADGRVKSVRDEIHTTPNTRYGYDPAGRLKTVKQTLTGAPDNEITTSYTYDLHGNLISVTDPNGNETTYLSDDFGRMLKQVSPVTGTTTYAYDPSGNLTSTTDANAASTTRTYDALNRVLTAVSTRTGLTTETVTWTYDQALISSFAEGRLTTLTGPEGAVKYKYDRRGLLLAEITPDTNTSFGEVTTRYRYDVDGNRSFVGYPAGRMSVTYTFDYAGRPAAATGTHLTAAPPGTATTALVSSASYMPFGAMKQIVFGNGTTRNVGYDNRYRIWYNTLLGPTGILAWYQYSYSEFSMSSDNTVAKISDNVDGAFDRSFLYDSLGRLIRARGPVARIAVPRGEEDQEDRSVSRLWGTATYTYDAMGNMKTASIGETPIDTSPEPGSFSADPLARPLARRTTFAHVGTTPKLENVAEWGRDVPSVESSASRRLSSFSSPCVTSSSDLRGRCVEYDDAGNETRYFATRTYSPRNLLASVTDPSEDGINQHTIQYGYDGRGIRVRRSEAPASEGGGTATRHYYYTPELQLLSVSVDDATNIWASDLSTVNPMRYEIIWFGGLPVAQTNSSDSLVAPRYTFTDHLGTPIIQTDASAQIIWRAEYEPFGNIYQMRVGERFDQPLRFPGQEVAMTWEGTEESYNIFRWYRSGWGRYTQADPIGIRGGLNVYSYTEGDPISDSDPSGLSSRRRDCTTYAQNILGALRHAIHHRDSGQSSRDICGMLNHWMNKFESKNCQRIFPMHATLARDYLNKFCAGPTNCHGQHEEDPWWERLQNWLAEQRRQRENNPVIPFVPPMPMPVPIPVIP